MPGAGIRGGFRNPLVTGAEIPDGTITTTKLADLAVTTAKIAALAVTTAKIDNLAVGSAQIAALAVTTAKIDALAVTTAKIAALAVTDAKIDTLSASKITAGTINTGTITVSSTLSMGSGSIIQFVRNGSATISTNDAPVNGDLWIEYRGNDSGAIIGLKKVSGSELVAAQLNVISDGFSVTTGIFAFRDGSAAAPSQTYGLDPDTGIFRHSTNQIGFTTAGAGKWFIANGGDIRHHDGVNGAPRMTFQASYASTPAWTYENDLNTGMRWESADAHGLVAGGQLMLRVNTDHVAIWEDFDDIGNHETLRADRTGGGTGVTEIGYFSSFRKSKREIVPLSRTNLWRSDWFDRITPVKYRRRSTQGREFGFILEDIAEISKYLTTKGDSVGDSIDEYAMLAVSVQALKEAREDVRQLQSRVDELERKAA